MRALWIITALLVCIGANADTITLEDGTQIEGRIVAETEDIVIVQVAGGSKKIDRADIREIVKGAAPKRRRKEKGPDIRNIGKSSMKDVEQDADVWIKVLELDRKVHRKKLTQARIDARLEKTEELSVWASEWCAAGYHSLSIDDIEDARFVLEQCRRNRDISLLKDRICRQCRGTQFVECARCRGDGTVMEAVRSKKTNAKGTRTVMVMKKKQCPICKGKGKVMCEHEWHAANKRIKKIGGIDKAVQMEAEMIQHNSAFGPIMRSKRDDDPRRLRKLAAQCHGNGYYYIMFELLERAKDNID